MKISAHTLSLIIISVVCLNGCVSTKQASLPPLKPSGQAVVHLKAKTSYNNYWTMSLRENGESIQFYGSISFENLSSDPVTIARTQARVTFYPPPQIMINPGEAQVIHFSGEKASFFIENRNVDLRVRVISETYLNSARISLFAKSDAL